MKNKRGLSQVVTTIILILLIIMAIAGIWVVVDRVILEGTEKINLEQFTIDLKIVSAKINYTSGTAEIKVKRNQGEGNLTGIKFIAEDPQTSEVYEERFERFEPLAQKTFFIDLIVPGSDLIISEIEKISIAPIYIGGGKTTESLGSITDSISGLENLNLTGSGEAQEIGNETGGQCILDIDCGEDYFIDGTKICNELNDGVLQYEKRFSCILGFCQEENILTNLESCAQGTICYDGHCITEPIPCTEETVEIDCGIDNWIGQMGCQSNPEAIIQNFRTYNCIEGTCQSYTEIIVREECVGEEICYEGECFEALECTDNADCQQGYVCEEGECVVETVMNFGTVRSAWPFGIGEYFDSMDLPINDTINIRFKYIIFPESLETRCLQIKDFVYPTFEGGISYVRLSTSPTNISDGDSYEVWETDYICTTL